MKVMKIILNLVILIVINSDNSILVSPQLNLPPLPQVEPTLRPNVYPNSYTPKDQNDQDRNRNLNNGDNDRSMRFGPPYGPISDLDGDDKPNDFRSGMDVDDRYRYNNYNNNNERRNQSPFSNGSYTTENYPPSVGYNSNRNNRPNPYDNINPYNNPYYNQSIINRNQQMGPNSENNYNNNGNRDRIPEIPPQFQSPKPPFGNNFQNINGQQIFNDPRNIDDERYRIEQNRRLVREKEKLRNFLIESDNRGSLECTANVAAQWNYETDQNPITQTEALLAQQKYSDYMRNIFELSRTIDPALIFDQNLARQYRLLSQVGPNALPSDQLDRYNRLINDMLILYNGASICAHEQPFNCGLKLRPELTTIMAKSRDWDELQHTWVEYHRKAGRPIRDSFEQLVELTNEIAFINNLTNGGEYWLSGYETPNFREEVESVWEQIRPFYEELHAYIRRKLREYYGPDKINKNVPIPEHILGNMYGQSLTNILDIIIPYPGKSFIDVTPRMIEQNYNPLIMFQLAEEFFISMNMSAMPPDFWRNSVIELLPNLKILCESSAWDFCNRQDYRIKMCSKIRQEDLITIHHEMAHIQYFLAYRHQPKVFRDGANPAFHEAIGDAIGLSVSTLKHLQTLGLIQKSVEDFPYDINYLFAMAVDKVAFLPFALSLEAWRYDVFSRRVNREMLNCHFWDLREQYGGIKPPVLRSELDFDPGAKYHVPANVPYMKYFVKTVLQFQIYRAMCLASRQYDPLDPKRPLHKCDVYRQPNAGNLLKRIMEKGSSQPWQQTLAEVIGENRLDGTALRDFFRPLEEWLRNENLRNQEFVGWIYDGNYCKRSVETANLQVYGGFYNAAELLQLHYLIHISVIILSTVIVTNTATSIFI